MDLTVQPLQTLPVLGVRQRGHQLPHRRQQLGRHVLVSTVGVGEAEGHGAVDEDGGRVVWLAALEVVHGDEPDDGVVGDVLTGPVPAQLHPLVVVEAEHEPRAVAHLVSNS